MRIDINDDFYITDDRGYSWKLVQITRGINSRTKQQGINHHPTWHATLAGALKAALNKGLLASDATDTKELTETLKRLEKDTDGALTAIQGGRAA